MNNNLEKFSVILETRAPLFIGSGKEIGKKEYIFVNLKEIAIPSPEKLYALMKKKSKVQSFEEYMLNPRLNIKNFLQAERMGVKEIEETYAYRLKSEETIDMSMRNLKIMEFVKDSYGMPYIPGSSIKGMLRTILLAYEIEKNTSAYEDIASNITRTLNNYGNVSKNNFLSHETKEMEGKAFRSLNKSGTKPNDAVNDVMQGFIVGDSEPLTLNDLILCQRTELHRDGTEKKLPVYRECIKPGVSMKFDMTIDHSACGYTKEILLEAIKNFTNKFYDVFLSKFDMDRPTDRSVYLGGGVGFVSKTVIYNIFDETDGIKNTVKIFDKTKVPQNHKHFKDAQEGVSPHVLKCARYKGKLYQMGECSFIINSD